MAHEEYPHPSDDEFNYGDDPHGFEPPPEPEATRPPLSETFSGVRGTTFSRHTDWRTITGDRYPKDYSNHQIMLREMQRQPINTVGDGMAMMGGTMACMAYDILMLLCADEYEKAAYFGTNPMSGQHAALFENIQSVTAGSYATSNDGWNEAFSRQVAVFTPPSGP